MTLNLCSIGSVKEEYNNLFQSFKIAWNSCRSFLGNQGTTFTVSLFLNRMEESLSTRCKRKKVVRKIVKFLRLI